ncbi:UNVERIFIED_ORG: hypothetical protein M2348_000794 [Sphingomonas sp. R1F5B]
MPRPRKAVRDRALEDLLLAGLAEGVTLRKLCRRHHIAPGLVQRWRLEDKDFARRFALAREAGFEAIAEETLEIADDDAGDVTCKEKADGSVAVAKNPDNVARARLRVETRLKLLSKWAPGKYGESTELGQAQDWSERLAAARARVLKGR